MKTFAVQSIIMYTSEKSLNCVGAFESFLDLDCDKYFCGSYLKEKKVPLNHCDKFLCFIFKRENNEKLTASIQLSV